ncbi:MAG: PRC-barrel domain-containing protein, partial [Nanoarchaeales archaeon]
DRIEAASIINRPVVTDKGRKLGEVADLMFDERTGEIVHIILKNPTENAIKLGLEKTKEGYLVPYSAVKAVGDFLVISEEEII